MKLSVALVTLVSVVLASPVPVSERSYNVDGSSTNSIKPRDIRLGLKGKELVDVPGIVGSDIGLLNPRDGDDYGAVETPRINLDDFDRLLNVAEPVGTTLDPALDGARLPGVLNARDADFAPVGDVTAIVEPEVEVLRVRDGDDSSATGIPVETLVHDINKSIGTKLNARQVQDLTRIVEPIVSNAGVFQDDGPFGGLPDKRDLSPAEIMANARKALSAAESDS
ncbi:hypothetical protein VF21_00530 [Pseudogymnoascus sp. 05NY08]|nr:hypothetical protein VF21_00530 [Pseudogymnoascus sp. 05NY08]